MYQQNTEYTVKEGVFLHQLGADPYDGGVFAHVGLLRCAGAPGVNELSRLASIHHESFV